MAASFRRESSVPTQLHHDAGRLEAHRFTTPSNANNPAVALPVEILHTIFIFCSGYTDDGGSALNPNPNTVSAVARSCPRYPPGWIAISYVCVRWRAVALDFRKLWSTITPDLSPQWIAACLERCAYAPKRVDIDVGPPAPAHRKRRSSTAKKKKRRAPVRKPPLVALPGAVVEEVFAHLGRIERLRVEGNTADVVRTLKALDGSMPLLLALSVGMWDEAAYPHFESGDEEEGQGEEERGDPSLVLSDALFGGCASRLRRLHLRSGLHVTFPSWVLGGVTEFTVSCSFCAKRLFCALGQMPQLEVLKVAPTRRYLFLPHSDEAAVPVTLNHLSLLVIEDTFLELLIALLRRLSVPADGVRMHLKLKLDGSKSDTYLWDEFSSLMLDMVADCPVPVHGIHFRREPSRTRIRLWVSPTEPATAAQGDHGIMPLSSSPWPPLDDPFSLEIHCTGRNCLYGLHTSYSVSFFHRLQELCVALGGPDVQELFVEYGTERNSCRRPSIPHRCWRTLFAGLPALKTLRFGDGAAELLVSALYGGAAAAVVPTSTAGNSSSAAVDGGGDSDGAAAAGRGFLSGGLQRVTVSRGAFSVRILWDWIHYAFARPAEWDASLLRMNVLADLSVPRWKSADIDAGEDVTESLLIFLLHCRSLGAQVELSLVEATWDEPGGLEILRRLLHILDPEWSVILETVSPD